MRYLAIDGFDRLQNSDIFKKSGGKPPWVKLYVKLLDNEVFEDFDYVTQLVYLKLLLLAARKENAIPNDEDYISRRIGIRAKDVRLAIDNLLESGWVKASGRTRRSRADSRISLEAVANDSPLDKKRLEETRNPLGPRKRDPLWDSLAALFGDPATDNERGKRNRAVKQLRDAGVAPDDIGRRARRWATVYPGATLTDMALVNHWTALAAPSSPASKTCPECGVTLMGALADHLRVVHNRTEAA